METIKNLNKKQIVFLVVMLLGVVLVVFLIQTKQVFRSKASTFSGNFEITQGNELREAVNCDGDLCIAKSLNVFIKPQNIGQEVLSSVEAVIIAPSPTPNPINSVPFASCNFTRSGRGTPFGSTRLLSWINDTAKSEGIPPAILASFARHESQYITTVGDDNEDILNNNYCNPGTTFCEYRGGVLYYDECSGTDIARGARTGRAMGLMQVVDIYNPGVDLCNISANIQKGAEIFKGKLGGGSFTDENSLKKAVCRYFGIDSTSCTYGGSDYAQEVWNDYQNCPSGH